MLGFSTEVEKVILAKIPPIKPAKFKAKHAGVKPGDFFRQETLLGVRRRAPVVETKPCKRLEKVRLLAKGEVISPINSQPEIRACIISVLSVSQKLRVLLSWRDISEKIGVKLELIALKLGVKS